MWQDQNGNLVQPYTLITLDDFQSGKYKLVYGNSQKVKECLIALEKAGKGGVCIWPEHCIAGTFG